MFNRNNSDNSSNFWISYADLMAGLLFVFILLIGAIVSKSIILKSNLSDKEDRLIEVSQILQRKEITLTQTRKVIEDKEKEIAIKDNNISSSQKTLELKAEEITKLKRMLVTANTRQDLLSQKIVLVQNILKETNTTMHRKNDDLKKDIKAYEGKIIVLSDHLTEVNNTVKQKNVEMLKLLNALDEKKTRYDGLVEKLQEQKAKIKSLTGIKLKVIATLKEELGDKIAIDKKSGSLRVSSNILFDKGSAQLKEDAKLELKQVFEEYIGTLVTNEKIKPHLDKIIIEGHTDSDGGYLYNLDLSQKRAFAVMNYLLSLDFAKQNNIKPLMTASGRAYLDAVMRDGVEDKEASRRIEVKFRLKNEDAMHEIEKVLDAD